MLNEFYLQILQAIGQAEVALVRRDSLAMIAIVSAATSSIFFSLATNRLNGRSTRSAVLFSLIRAWRRRTNSILRATWLLDSAQQFLPPSRRASRR